MLTDAHSRIISVAATLCRDLHAAVLKVGELEPLQPPTMGLRDRLFLEIVNQQLSSKAADAIWARIEEAGQRLEVPVSELLQERFEAEVLGCGLSRNKLKALRAVAEAAQTSLLDENHLADLGHEERAQRLTSIWGIGQWTADMIGIFFFHDPDIWPDGDVAARGMLRRITGSDQTIEFAAEFAPHRSTLARYMWRARDLPKETLC